MASAAAKTPRHDNRTALPLHRAGVLGPRGAAPDRRTLGRRALVPRGIGGAVAMSAENVVALVVSALLLGYLVVALILPERF